MTKKTWIIIIIAVVVIGGIIGYVLYNRSQKKKAAAIKAKTGSTPVDTTNKPGTDPGAGKPFSNLSGEQNMGYVMMGEKVAGT